MKTKHTMGITARSALWALAIGGVAMITGCTTAPPVREYTAHRYYNPPAVLAPVGEVTAVPGYVYGTPTSGWVQAPAFATTWPDHPELW